MGAAYVLIFLLTLTLGAAIGVRPEPRVPVSAGEKPIAAARAPTLEVTPSTQESPAATSEATMLPARLLKDWVVVVEPRQTLSQISLRYLGRYSLPIVQQLQALNPGLNPNHIEVGQRVRLPFRPEDSTELSRDENKHRRIIAQTR